MTTELAVLIPVFADEAGLCRSLESLRSAGGSFDIFVVDDTVPESIPVPERLREDVTIEAIRGTGKGIAAALNFGLRHILSRGYRYVARLDAGDTIDASRFSKQKQFLDANPKCGVVSSFADFEDAAGNLIFQYRAPRVHREIVSRMHIENCMVHPGLMFRAEVFREAGLYREGRTIEDYELLMRVARNWELAVLPEVLTRCQYSADGLSVKHRREGQMERLKLQLRFFDPLLPQSYYGIARSALSLVLPHNLVLRGKQVVFARQ